MADVSGTAAGETLYGFDTDDRIYAKAGNDILYGGLGNDLLDGMTGADTMFGGAGNDRYRVDDAGDVVDEDADDNGDDGGIELVESTISYTLGAYLENLTLIGTGAIDGTGNGLANKLVGNGAANTLSGGDGADTLSGGAGADTLIGGSGKDSLTGGTGSDTFVFGPADAASTDNISDFTSEDRIGINAAAYGLSEGHGLINGALDPDYFAIVASGTQGTASGHGQFVYNSAARSLMWDADGAGSASAGVALTTFSSNVASLLTPASFAITGSAEPPPPPPPPTQPVVSIGAGAPDPQQEGANAKISFTVSLDRAASQEIVVSYSTLEGTATAADFVAVTNGSITFAPGETSKVIEVQLQDDALVEDLESFSLKLDSATNASLGASTATANIIDDDKSGGGVGEFKTITYVPGAAYMGLVDTFISQANPTTSYGSSARLEVDGGSGVTIQSLLAFNDIFGVGSSQIPFGAKVTSASLTVQVSNASAQGGSLYRMTADWNGQSTWASLVDGIGLGTEAVASADLVTGSVALGARSFDVTQSLQSWAGGSANKGWVFNPGGTDGWDFGSAEGSIKPTLSVTYWTGDGAPPEPPPVITVAPGAPNPQTEGSGAPITFQVTLSKPASSVVTVDFATSNGSATAGADYTATSGTLTFQPGDVSKDILVMLVDDSTGENAESFNLALSSPVNGSPGTSSAVGNIRDDDFGSIWQVSQPVLVRATDTRLGQGANIGAVDPAGIAWIPAQGSTPGKLFVSDSEVDESPYNSAYNLFTLNLDGSPQGSPFKFDLRSFTKEPTGLAFNPLNQMLYISDDDFYKVFWVNPADPTKKVGEFDVRRAGATDPEDIAIDPATGHIFIANGTPSHKITEVTATGDFVRDYTIPSVVKDMEALAYDAQHDVFLVGGGFSSSIWVIDRNSVILDTIDLSAYRNPVSDTRVHVKDIAIAPTSAANDDPSLMNLYVADYGETHTTKANDGRILEIDLGWHLIA